MSTESEKGWGLGSTVARRGDWELTLHWREMRGRIECVGIDVRSFRMRQTARSVEHRDLPGSNGPRPLTRGVLSRLPLVDVLADAREDHRSQVVYFAHGGLTGLRPSRRLREAALEQLPAWERDREARQPATRGRRRTRLGPEHYARVMHVRDQAEARGLPPTKTVAEVFSVPYPTAASWVHRARKIAEREDSTE